METLVDMAPKPVRLLVVAGAAAWCGAVVAAPLFELESLYVFFSAICHQLPERTWFIAGAPLAVCIRCSSIYLGFFLALLIGTRARPALLKFALVATALEFLVAQAGLDHSALRAATGVLLGLSAAPHVEAGVSELFRQRGIRFHARPTP